MRVAVFSIRPYDRQLLGRANAAQRHELGRTVGVVAVAADGARRPDRPDGRRWARPCWPGAGPAGGPGRRRRDGNSVCPSNIVAGAATVELAGREAEILRRTLLPCLGYLALAGVALWWWVQRAGPG